MRETFLTFGRPLISEAEIDEVVDSLRSGWIGTGPKVHRFETMLGEYLGVPNCRCVSSCTAALILAMQVLGIGAGDEVLVPAMTFVASANAVEHAGARPVLVDCRLDTGLIDLDAAEVVEDRRHVGVGDATELDHVIAPQFMYTRHTAGTPPPSPMPTRLPGNE
jgi:dTDP-4-amino-4,6-dideoxygalactose transaminase